MKEIKKGDAPKDNTQTQTKYSKLMNLCLFLSILGMAMMFIGYAKSNEKVMFTGIGMAGCSSMFQLVMNMEDDDD